MPKLVKRKSKLNQHYYSDSETEESEATTNSNIGQGSSTSSSFIKRQTRSATCLHKKLETEESIGKTISKAVTKLKPAPKKTSPRKLRKTRPYVSKKSKASISNDLVCDTRNTTSGNEESNIQDSYVTSKSVHGVTKDKRDKQGVKNNGSSDNVQGFVKVNSKILTEESLQQLTRLDTIQAVLPSVCNPLDHEVTFYTDPQAVTNIFTQPSIPSYSKLQLWKEQLKQIAGSSKPGHWYIEVRDCRYNIEAVDQMLILHKAKDIRCAVEKELQWFAGSLIIPKSVRTNLNSDSMRKFQDLVFHHKWNEELIGYGMSGEELANVCCNRCLSPGIIQWMLNMLNTPQDEVLCIYHDPNYMDNEKYIRDCLDRRKQAPTSLFVVCSVGRSKDGVFMSCNKQPGCHFSFCNVTRHDDRNEIVYGDSLGWPAPDNLQDVLAAYFQAVFKCPMTDFEMTMCHSPHQNPPDFDHTCSTDNLVCAQNFPLQKCGSISSVVTLLMAGLACHNRASFDLLTSVNRTPSPDLQHLKDPSGNAKYLRRVLASWIADKEVCVDYLIPKSFESDSTDDEDGDDLTMETSSGNLQEEVVVNGNLDPGEGRQSCLNDSYQDNVARPQNTSNSNHGADKDQYSCLKDVNEKLVADSVNESNSNNVQCKDARRLNDSEVDAESSGTTETQVLLSEGSDFNNDQNNLQSSTSLYESSSVGSHGNHMHNTGVSHVNHMHSTGVSHVNHMHNTRVSHVNHMHSTGVSHVNHMHSTGVSHVQGTLSQSSSSVESSSGIHHCPKCDYTTELTFNMRRHLKRHHPDVMFAPPDGHTCPSCNYSAKKSYDVFRHITSCHPGVNWKPQMQKQGPKAKEGPKRHKCPQCPYESNSKHNINRHQQNIHETTQTLEPARIGKCQCLECGQRLYKISDLRRHLSTKHAFIFKIETVTLDSYQEFEEWKASMEIAEGCSFTKSTGDKVIQGGKRTQYFQCNRSGMFRSNNKGKRRQKWQGSCKIEGNCTSTMVASILHTGQVEVECVCTHYSHQIELQHVWVPKGRKRDNSAPKRDQSQNREQIVNNVCDSVGNAYGTHHALTKQSIPDIVELFVPSTIQRSPDDQSSLLSWIKQWKDESESESNPILGYKIHDNVEGFDKPGLLQDEFIIIIQTQLQKEMMQTFGKNGICCDSTKVGSKFALTTVQVCDEFHQSHPIAFCLSSDNTQPFMNIFFSSVRTFCGDFCPEWFLSPLLEHFHDAWEGAFGAQSRRLICPWFVEEAWADSLKKMVGNESIESMVRKLLEILLEQTEQKLFEDHLQTLLDRLAVSAKTQEFRRYFLNHWVSRKPEWTYCSAETHQSTMFTQPFYHSFQHEYSNANISEGLDMCVLHLLKHARDGLVRRRVNLTKGKPLMQAGDVQDEHAASTRMDAVCVKACLEDSHRWEIQGENHIVHTVQESAAVCKHQQCPVTCAPCKLCIHQYMCSCLHYLTHPTICKHIHLVHTSIHKDGGEPPVRNTQWLKDRIQSRVQRLLAVVNSTSSEHFSVLQELDSKLGTCSSLLDARLLWGPTHFVQPKEQLPTSSPARKERKRSGPQDWEAKKKKHKRQEKHSRGDHDASSSLAEREDILMMHADLTNPSKPTSSASLQIPPSGAAPVPIHVTSSQPTWANQKSASQSKLSSVSQVTHGSNSLSNIGPILASQASRKSILESQVTRRSISSSQVTNRSISASHQLIPSTLSSPINRTSPQRQQSVTYPPTQTIISSPADHLSPHKLTPIPHETLIHNPGTSHMPHTQSYTQSHPQLAGITASYQQLRPPIPSQLLPGTSQSAHIDLHQTVRPVVMTPTDSQQLATMSDEQLTTLAGVASALFGDGLNTS